MRYAIVESGGKQFKVVEGGTLEVDRLHAPEGTEIALERILLMADGADFLIGTPTLSGIEVKATVVDHFSGTKVTHFRYSPKKRIRVRGGHRQQYTRLRVDFIGSKGEVRKPVRGEAVPEEAEHEAKPAANNMRQPEAKEPGRKATDKRTGGRKPEAPPKTSGGSTIRKSKK